MLREHAQSGGGTNPGTGTGTGGGAVTLHASAFDALGDLWMTWTDPSDGHSSLGMVTPAQLAAAGARVPYVPLSTAPGQGGPAFLVMNPSPAGLPLSGIPR